MKKDLTEIVFIIDRSGSMAGLENDTIGGYNSFIKKQKEMEGDCFVTTLLFDDQIEYLYKNKNIEHVKKLTEKEYYVRGTTALLDAVGQSIVMMKHRQRTLEEDKKASKVLFVITTDGYENASHEYSYKDVKAMIEKQRDVYDWEFIFMGADMDAAKEAGKLGIHENRSVTYCRDEIGVALSYESVQNFAENFRNNCRDDSNEWKIKAEKDYKKRR